MIRIVVVVLAAGGLLAGCKTRNELSCEAPENMGLAECSTVDGQPACGANGECAVGVCKMPDNICVPCLTNTDCTTATTPVCNQTTNTCEACNAHDDCDSNACDLDSGECFAEADVAYVANGGTGACTKAEPCADLNVAIATTKTVIRVLGATVINVNAAQDVTRDVRIFGDVGAGFRRPTTDGPIVTLNNSSAVEISDLVLRDGRGSVGDGISMAGTSATLTLQRVFLLNNDSHGINATAGDSLTVRRCVLAANDAGGIDLRDLKFEITNSIIADNGSGGSVVGGLRVSNADAGSTLQFTTIAGNVTGLNDQAHAGVNCDAGFDAANNIVTSNALDTVCTFTFSLFDNSTMPLPGGNGNKAGDPKFEDVDPLKADRNTFFRIKDGSAAIDQADPAATEAIDVDGDARPKGTARDMGADEH